jgi:DNA transformation protein
MAASEGFKDFIRDQLAGFGPITIRNMFSGAGIYADGVMFALVANDVLYLKADKSSARAFAAEGMSPFTYHRTGKAPVAMSYWEAPPRLLEEPDQLAAWARGSYRVACAAKTKRSRKPRRR